MLRIGPSTRPTYLICLALALQSASGRGLRAQDLSSAPERDVHDLVLPRDLFDWGNRSDDEASVAGRSRDRFRLFCMPAAFPSNPLALDLDNDPPGEEPGAGTATDLPPAPERLQLALGLDNPYFDFRRPGDPGGVGYYRMNSQLLLLDGACSGLCLGLQAYTPAGLDADGLAEGPTVLSPNVAWFYRGEEGTALQGFIGKNLRTRPGWTDNLQRGIEYGLALQSPCLRSNLPANQNVHWFIEALGRYHFDTEPYQRPGPNVHFVPGLRWQLNEAWWVAGGVLMPLGPLHSDNRLWQFTCSWQF
jgi:hypothetical protein